MKKKNYFLMYFMTLVCICISCNNDIEFNGSKNDKSFDPTRKVFADEKAVTEFLQENASSIEEGNNQFYYSTILERLVKTTPFGKLVNDKFEYQIGDYIHKFGTSGYTEYKILASKYEIALTQIEKDDVILAKLDELRKLDDITYEISEGIYLIYTGIPLIEATEITPPDLRISADGRTKVRVSFQNSYNYLFSDCSIHVEAFENVNGEFIPYKTDIRANWTLGINAGSKVEYSSGNPGLITGRSSWYQTLLSTSVNVGEGGAPRYSLNSGTMSGSCKCWDGQWITATWPSPSN